MGCSCRKYNLNESIYELADTLSDRDVDRKFSLFNKITKSGFQFENRFFYNFNLQSCFCILNSKI